MPPKVAVEPKPTVAPKAPAAPKLAFRTNSQGVGTRPVEAPAAEPRPSKANPAELPPAKTRIAESKPAKPSPTPAAKVTKLAKLTTPEVAKEPVPAKTRTAEVRSTPSPKSMLAPAIAAIPAPKMSSGTVYFSNSGPAVPSRVEGRYPWKSGIVTTVFWIGEPVSGNNFTPNHASSWDANWAANYGGFDNPDPAARRNFIPVKFTPRQNPFYIALPYNDVTRGTTKPEARRVIPWFKDAFRREGQSVCRDRWVAVRNRAGKVAYAQWSDCGPFRTDHWQYVFGSERPKPNLNKGAGLDVSPAVRDYLGLSSTDVTDWRFVEFRDVPSGPWAVYGQNNTFAQKGSRMPRETAKASGQTADTTTRIRLREL